MTETAGSELQPYVVNSVLVDEHPYTPREIAQFFRVGKTFVQDEIAKGRLRAFKFGGRLWRIRGREAKRWVDELENMSLEGSPDATASYGGRRILQANAAAGDLGFRSTQSAPKPRP
jgi:excisionase family DNA binding protein